MTQFRPSFSGSNSSFPSIARIFQRDESGRNSPRSQVAEDLSHFHITHPSMEEKNFQRNQSFSVEIPQRKVTRQSYISDVIQSNEKSTEEDIMSPTSAGSPSPQTDSGPSYDDMDIDVLPNRDTITVQICHSSPPSIVPSDSEGDTEENISPPDELTRYLRQRKREEQILACRLRELKDEREARIQRRNKLQTSKVTKSCTKKVRFVA